MAPTTKLDPTLLALVLAVAVWVLLAGGTLTFFAPQPSAPACAEASAPAPLTLASSARVPAQRCAR